MKKKLLTAATSAALLLSASVAIADEEEMDTVKMSMGDIKVKVGHGSEFRSGLAAWKECQMENDGTSTWGVYQRQDGESGHYAVNFPMEKWGDMDEDNPASEACSSIVQEQIQPHIESSSWRWSESMPEISKDDGGGNIWLVYYFRVDDGMKFNEAVTQMSAAVAAIEGDEGGYWYELYGGDEHAADYLVAVPFESYSEWDGDDPGVWEMVNEHHGEEKAGEIRSMFRDSLDAGWDYTYEYLADLSHTGEE